VLSKVAMYSEDGTLEQIQSYKKGVVSKYEFFREDGTTEQVDTYENGVYKNSQ
jgi:antitoxin component YwqK of YwqJK toxin-antitoxin module